MSQGETHGGKRGEEEDKKFLTFDSVHLYTLLPSPLTVIWERLFANRSKTFGSVTEFPHEVRVKTKKSWRECKAHYFWIRTLLAYATAFLGRASRELVFDGRVFDPILLKNFLDRVFDHLLLSNFPGSSSHKTRSKINNKIFLVEFWKWSFLHPNYSTP